MLINSSVIKFKCNQIQEALMNNNVVDSIIASIIFGILSTGVGIILQALGFSAQVSIIVALFVLLALVLLFIVAKSYYPIYIKGLTERLLEKTLQENRNGTNGEFKKKIIKRVLKENLEGEPRKDNWITEFSNQEACESNIREASRNARKVKILTVRGQKYFLGPDSLLHDLISPKRIKNSSIEVLVLSLNSQHITDDLAEELRQHSAKVIRERMRIVLESLEEIAKNKNFKVRCYDETPNFKILLFDDTMFVSAFTEPKNDRNAKMLQITREGNPLFIGFERYFDNLWDRSSSPW